MTVISVRDLQTSVMALLRRTSIGSAPNRSRGSCVCQRHSRSSAPSRSVSAPPRVVTLSIGAPLPGHRTKPQPWVSKAAAKKRMVRAPTSAAASAELRPLLLLRLPRPLLRLVRPLRELSWLPLRPPRPGRRRRVPLQRAEMLKRRMCRNPNEFCDVSYLCVGRTGPCSALTYHKLKLTEMSQCECEGCAKAVIQGGAVSTDTASEAMGMLAQFMERNDFICNKPDEYKDACKEVDGYMCTLRVEALVVNTVTGLQSTRGGSIDTCLRNSCAHCYNRRPWDPHSGCGESIASLHFMRADNRHLRNALLEMFGNEEMSDVLITKLEYRCSTKSYVDVGSIVGGSTAGSVMAMLLLVVFLLVVKRKVRDETRAVMLLGKSEEEKNKLLDEWGIGYKAKRAKEIAKATKAHKKELKRKENELKAAQKAAAKRKRKEVSNQGAAAAEPQPVDWYDSSDSDK